MCRVVCRVVCRVCAACVPRACRVRATYVPRPGAAREGWEGPPWHNKGRMNLASATPIAKPRKNCMDLRRPADDQHACNDPTPHCMDSSSHCGTRVSAVTAWFRLRAANEHLPIPTALLPHWSILNVRPLIFRILSFPPFPPDFNVEVAVLKSIFLWSSGLPFSQH